jgi:hypothetical protein
MAWEDFETGMLTAQYRICGQSVTYNAQDADAKTIFAIVDDAAEVFGFETETAERVARARVKLTDVVTPRRGDLITMSAGIVYEVDGVEKNNNVEWLLTLTERDR